MKTLFTSVQTMLLVLFCVVSTWAGRPKTSWQTGRLSFWDNTILEGELSYNWSAETVLLRQTDGRVRAYSASQIRQFGWFDYEQAKQRTFVSLANPTGPERFNQTFFEIYMDGSLKVVRRLKRTRGIAKWILTNPAYYTDEKTLTQNPDQFNYYVYEAGNFLNVDRFYSDIYQPLLTLYDQELQTYVRNHNINARTLLGRLVLIDHFNFLSQQEARTASARPPGNAPH
ncbi:hypothetical protein HNV11_02125 [Spirosoma taeanense]|uniref:Uncharacterized protein n=1 Tax=Spirosoma taeanense TaxID=2735870 RepID=A0A6M5Y0E5_9BACT|nr:hypothetical protein [Spirosoma taeanense]QJW88257.1 hypothetical protein HNV11_02125 [Spirosoma taeanense]